MEQVIALCVSECVVFGSGVASCACRFGREVWELWALWEGGEGLKARFGRTDDPPTGVRERSQLGKG